jgi:hypothetical protein
MSADRDVTRIVRSWLKEDAHEDPQRLLDGLRHQLDTAPQRRPWWLARRSPEMNSVFRILVPAAAVVVIALVGIRLASPGISGGAVATPTVMPTPTVTPTAIATPTASPVVPRLPAGALEAGRYLIKVPDAPLDVALTLGSGWNAHTWYVNSDEFDAAIAFFIVANVYDDICAPGGGLPTASLLPAPPIGPTVDDLVSALDAQVNTDLSPAVDVVVGGYAGKRVTITESDPTAHCAGGEPRPMWISPSGEAGRQMQPGALDTLWIVDVDGQRLVILTVPWDPSDVEATARLAAVIDSMTFSVP